MNRNFRSPYDIALDELESEQVSLPTDLVKQLENEKFPEVKKPKGFKLPERVDDVGGLGSGTGRVDGKLKGALSYYENNRDAFKGLSQNELPWALAIMAQESGGKSNALSPAGARGLMQHMPISRQQVKNTHGIDVYASDANNIKGGVLEFNRRLKMFGGDVDKALAAYNAGEGNVLKAMKRAEREGGTWTMYLPRPEETLPYIRRVKGYRNALGGTSIMGDGEGYGLPRPKAKQQAADPTAGGRFTQMDERAIQRMNEAIERGDDSFVPFAGAKPIKIGNSPAVQTKLKERQQKIDDAGVLTQFGEALGSGYDNTMRQVNNSIWLMKGGDTKSIAENIYQGYQTQQQRMKRRTTGQQRLDKEIEDVGKADGFFDTIAEGAGAVLTAIQEPRATFLGAAESTASMIPSLVGGAAGAGAGGAAGAGVGAIAGGVGAVPGGITGAIWGGRFGMVAGTTATEAGAELEYMVFDRLKQQGKPVTKENINALLNDPKFRSQAQKQGAAKGLTIGIVDQLSMGLSGRVLSAPARQAEKKAVSIIMKESNVTEKAARSLLASPAGRKALAKSAPSTAKKAMAAVGAFGVELLGEPVGEAASQMVARGDVDGSDVMGEFIYGAGQAVAGAGTSAVINKAQSTAKNWRGQNIQAEDTTTPAGTQAQDTATPNAAPTDTVTPSQPARKVGPLERAVGGEQELDAAIDAERAAVTGQPVPEQNTANVQQQADPVAEAMQQYDNTVAETGGADQWLGAAGTQVDISPKEDPESTYRVTVEGYENGEVLARDQDGMPLQFSQADIASASPVQEAAAPDAKLDTVNQAIQQQAAPQQQAAAEIQSPEANIEQQQQTAAQEQQQAVQDNAPTVEKTLEEMDETELRNLLKATVQQAKQNGGSQQARDARRQIEAEINKRTASAEQTRQQSADLARQGSQSVINAIDQMKASQQKAVPAEQVGNATVSNANKPLNDGAITPLMGADGKPKWFMSQDKAQAHIDKKKLTGKYEVKKVENRRFEIHPVASAQVNIDPTLPSQPSAVDYASDAEFDAMLDAVPAREDMPQTAAPTVAKTTTEKPIRTYGFDRVKMANNLSMEELDQLKRQVEAEHANPRNEQGQYLENGQPSLSLYDKKGLKKLDDISWAVYHKTKKKDVDQANVSKEADKIDTTAERVDAGNTEPKQKAKAAPSANTLVSDDRAAELRARLKAKLTQLNSGIDPEIMAIGAELAVYHIERGARKFAAFAQNIAADLDVSMDKVRPYLRSWYNGARDMMEDMGGSIEGMDDAETVRAELAKLDQVPAAEQTQAPAPKAAPKNPFQKYHDVAQQYGRSVNAKGEILGQNGKPTGVRIVEKKQRIRIERIEGNQLLFTAAKPEGLGKFLEDYWFDKKQVKPAEAKAAAPVPSQDKAKNPNGPHQMTIEGRRVDGGPIIPGHQFITSSGRLTTPYPKQKSEKYASQWLIDNAVAEAEARGDRFNTRIFSSYKPMKNGELSTADREGMLMYLYGEQPAVVPSIFKDDSVEDRNVSSTAERVERNRQEPAAAQSVNAPTNGNAGAADAAGTGTASPDSERQSGAGQRDQRVSTDGTVAGRERGDQRVHRDDGQFEPTQRPAGDTERTGGGIDGGTGSTVEQQRANDVVKNAQAAGTSELDQRLAAQAKADKTPTKWGDKASIDAALPLLLDPQRDDVLKAENRLSQDNGILFTNGTGTGKTATGMGVAKRYINAGKDNIVIVVPSDKIAADWVKFAKMLNVEVNQLADSSSNGDTGPIVTTYANFGQNPSLVNRKWDLIITDESHYLSSNEKGDGTAALEQLRALTGHHAGFYAYVKQKYAKELAALDKARQAGPRGPDVPADRIAKLQAAEDKALKAWQEIQDRERPKWEARWEKQQDIPKVLMLSATPFAYVKNTDYAEGYLFHYVPPAELKQSRGQGRGYNQGGPREQFMMQHFGYRMRTGKLTAPEAGVNSQLLEQNFNQWLKDQGALSGRRLDVPFDYDRKFVLVDDAVGTKIDNALKYLHEQSMQAEAKARESNGDENAKKQGELWSNLYAVVNSLFDYQSRMYLLEAIKAKAAIPMIQKHLDLGRKVVVFHDYNKGGGFDPFRAAIGKALTADQKAFNKKVFDSRPDLFNLDLTDLVSPIEALTKAFPQALEFNGTISKANRRANADKFNKDNSEHNLIIVQSDAGREGVSLHDTSGVHQRVEINLGMPVKPVAATQIEGRIYRTGQASNAIFRYLTTGTGWESAAFSRKIAERASTAENLALGLEARGLKESFIDAYQNADIHEPGEADGLGGKEYDRSMSASNSITPFDKAKTFYWAQQKNTKSRGQREGADYYATPEPVGFKMVEFADIKTGNKVLEPSAGHGAIARWFPDQTDVTMVEPSYDLAQRAGLANGTARIINDTFENLHVTNKYDAIVMNPPYGNGGKISTDHLAKAATHLRDGGRIVALLPRGGMADNRLAGFLNSEEAKDLYVVARINMPSSTFERAGTSVNTQILVLEKHKNERDATGITEKRIDLSNAKDVTELFDRMEDLTIEPRKESTSLESKYEIVEHVTQNGKVLRGIIRTDINKFTAQQIDPYAFRKKNEDGKQGWFIRERWLTPDVKFSRPDTTGTGTTVEQVRTALADRFGEKTIAKLEKDGVLSIVDTYADPGVEGFTQGGKVTLVSNGLTADNIVPVFLHELGGHVGMQGVMKPEAYSNLMDQFNKLVDAKDPIALEAKRLAERETDANVQADEYLPYLVTVASRAQNMRPGVRTLLNRIVAAVKAWAVDKLGLNLNLSANDVVALAERMVQTMSRQPAGNAAMQFSRVDAPQSEIDAVRQQYEGTGQWMKAPNGKDTNLGEQQWLQVRTPSFKNWFGDWENGAENASKVVDENGEPMIVYHGSTNSFTAFDPRRLSENSGNDGHYGAGIYFSNDYAEARTYGGNIMQTFLNIRNPVRNTVESLEPFAETFGYEKEFKTVDKQWLADQITKKDPNAGLLANLFADGYTWENVWSEFEKRGGQYRYDNTESTLNLDDVADVFGNINESLGYYDKQFIEENIGTIPENKKVFGYDNEPDILDITDRGLAGQWFSNTVKAAGHDGVIAGSEFVIFDANQVKSATDNVGAFDAANPDIRFSRRDNQDNNTGTSRSFWKELKSMPTDMLTKFMRKGGLAAVPLRPMLTELASDMPSAGTYLRTKELMDAMRNKWHAKTDAVAQDWLKYRISNRAENRDLMDLMHESTLQQVDPSKPFKPMMTGADMAALKTMSPENPNYKALQDKADRDAKRKEAHKKLQEQYKALSPEAQKIYGTVRDSYSEMADAFDKVLLENMQKAIEIRAKKAEREHAREMERINDEGLTGEERDAAIEAADLRLKNVKTKISWNSKARMTLLRKQFESNRLTGPYFPLARFGDLFVTVRDAKTGEVVSFSRFESEAEQRRFADEMRQNAAYKVEVGAIANAAEKRKAVDAKFVADVEDILSDLPNADQVKDEVWQRYLETLPDMSVRKSRIHRKGRAGFNADAVRAFGHHLFHGAHQLARMKYSMDLEDALDTAKDEARKTKNPVRSGLIVNEMEKAHQFIMNPTGSQWAQAISSTAFVWCLAGSPKAALVNLSQTPIMGVPILAAFDGAKLNSAGRASAHLLRAYKNFAGGLGKIDQSKGLTAEERDAIEQGYETGVIDKTQGHELAGVAETGVEYNAAREKVMRFISWGFHQTERLNREVTFLAAYRMAREKGMAHDEAITTAGQLTWKIHYDYANTSRPRFMRNDAAKALLVFRNYQVNMLFRLFRDTHQAFQGETPQVRREAFAQLAGITGMMMLNAGITGTWLFGIAMLMAGLFMEDGEDPEEELKKAIVGTLGPELGGMAMYGIPGHLTGTSLSGSIGMPDLWFRSPESTQDTDDARSVWMFYVSQLLGAGFSMPLQWLEAGFKISNGDVYRGIEYAAPKMIKDPMKAYRYASEDVLNAKGDLVTEADFSDVVKQALGFTPARIAEQYEINSKTYNKQTLITGRRKELLDDYYKAWKAKDEEAQDTVKADIKAFNEKYPEKRITPPNLVQSIKNRRKGEANAVGGARYDVKLKDRLVEDQAPSIYNDE